MKWHVLLLVLMSSMLLGKPVERDVYLTGAWGARPGGEGSPSYYEKAGFTLIQEGNHRWLTKKDWYYIGTVSGRPPTAAARPFESADGKIQNSISLFTHVNFNAPSVEEWWNEYVPQVVERKFEPERIRFWKVHNEFGYSSGDIFDYSPGSISKYRDWLKARYGTVEKLNSGWKSSWKSFDDVEPPRKNFKEQLGNWLDWRRFTSWNFGRYFRETGDLVRQKVPAARVSDNFYNTTGLDGWDLFELAKQTDYLALDIYAIGRWAGLMSQMDLGRSAARAWGKPFLMMEYHAGPNHWITEVYDWHLYVEALLALARESRALQWYMWNSGKSGREEGIHGILDWSGNPTERLTAVTRTSAFLQRFAPVFNRMGGKTNVGIVISNDSQYLQRALGMNVHLYKTTNQKTGRLMNLSGYAFSFVDAQQLPELNLSEYDALILAGCPVVSTAARKTLEAFIDRGKVVVIHPEAGLYDEFGHPVSMVEWEDETVEAKEGDLFALRNPKAGEQYRMAVSPWVMSKTSIREPEKELAVASEYGKFLASLGVKPGMEIACEGIGRGEVDVRLLRDNKLNVLFVTKTTKDPADLTLKLNGFDKAATGWFYAPDTAAVRKVEGKVVDGALQFTLALGDNAGCGGVLLFGEWQPVVDLSSASGQDTFRPGEQTELLVGVVNLGTVAVSGRASLTLPAGWVARPVSGDGFTGLRPGERTQVAFKLEVPADASLDFFGINTPIEAKVTFTEGASGDLFAKMHPFVKPTLDVRVVYRDKMLNPWQELTPPVLRWGWDNEVRTPPPAPMAIRGDTPAILELDCRKDLIGKPLSLSVVHEDGTPGKIRVADGGKAVLVDKLPVIFDLPKSGTYRLTADVAGYSQMETFLAAAGIETAARVLANTKAQKPGSIKLAVAAERRSAGTPLLVAWPTDADGEVLAPYNSIVSGRLYDSSGRLVPFEFSKGGIEINADVAADGVSVFEFVPNEPRLEGTPRLSCEQVDAATMVVTGDTYRMTLNTLYGWITKMELKTSQGWRDFLVERSGPVLKTEAGNQVGPESSEGVTLFSYTFTSTSGYLEFERPYDGGKISLRERWWFEPNHAKVDVRLFNRTMGPLRYGDFTYEIGVNGKTSPKWCVLNSEGEISLEGTMPSNGQSSARQSMVFFSPEGASMAVTLRRSAQNLSWASIANSVKHSPNVTKIDFIRSFTFDPVDFLLGEFDLWMSSDGLPAQGDPGLTWSF